MRLPIVQYPAEILRQPAIAVQRNYPQLHKLIHNMWDSMYAAHGCGLAAPQVNIPIRLFVADSISTWQQVRGAERLEQFPDNKGIREVFINPEIIYQSDTTATDLEGCLSIPGKSGQVVRPWQITIRYLDARFREQEKTYAGFTARMIQHEMDHLDGILYIDKM